MSIPQQSRYMPYELSAALGEALGNAANATFKAHKITKEQETSYLATFVAAWFISIVEVNLEFAATPEDRLHNELQFRRAIASFTKRIDSICGEAPTRATMPNQTETIQ